MLTDNKGPMINTKQETEGLPVLFKALIILGDRFGVSLLALIGVLFIGDRMIERQNAVLQLMTQAIQDLTKRTEVDHKNFEAELQRLRSEAGIGNPYGKQAQSYSR